MVEETCKEHSGCLADIDHLKKSDEKQWECIDDIKRKMTYGLGFIIATLVSVLVNIFIK